MNDDARPGWGILSTGWIAGCFAEDLRVADRRLVAVGSRTAEAARAFADRHGVPHEHAHGSWQALAEDPDVDVVYVATPHPGHAEAARVLLEAGKHVLIEKPFTLNTAEAEAVQALAAERGLIALEAMWTRWLPHMLEIRAAIDAGDIGDPQLLIADHTQAISTDPAHRLNDPMLGGGALLDLGVYPISFAIDLFGEPEWVDVAATWTSTGVDQRVTGTLVHPGGRHTSFTAASDLAGPTRAAVVGTSGSIDIEGTWYAPTGYTILDADRRVVRTSRPEVAGRGMQYEALATEELIRAGRTEDARMTPAGTLAVMRTLDRIRAAIGLVYPQEQRTS